MNRNRKYRIGRLTLFCFLCLALVSCSQAPKEIFPKSITMAKISSDPKGNEEMIFEEEDYPIILDFLKKVQESPPVEKADFIPDAPAIFVVKDNAGKTYTFEFRYSSKDDIVYFGQKGAYFPTDEKDPKFAAFTQMASNRVQAWEEAKKGDFRPIPMEIGRVFMNLGLGSKERMDLREFDLPQETWDSLESLVGEIENHGETLVDDDIPNNQSLVFVGSDYRFSFVFPYMELANDEIQEDRVKVILWSGNQYKSLVKEISCEDPALKEILRIVRKEDPWQALWEEE